MNLARLSIANWPIWLKLVVVLVIAVMIPSTLGFWLLDREVRRVDLHSLEVYLTDQGEQRQAAIHRVFEDAHDAMAAFTDSFSYRSLLISIMRGFSAASTEDALHEHIDGQLIASGLFSGLIALNPEGQVVLSNGVVTAAGREPVVPLGTDFSGSLVFQAARTAATLREDQRLILDNTQPALAIDLIQVMYRSEEVAGYVIGTIDYETSLYGLLRETGDFVSTTSYLITADGEVLTAPEKLEPVQASAKNNPAVRAFANEPRTDIYEVDAQRLVSFYAPIPDTPFALVIETDTNTAFTVALLDVYNRVVLAIVAIVVIGVLLAMMLNLLITAPLRSLQEDVQAMGKGDFVRYIETIERGDEIGKLAQVFANVREHVRILIDDLQSRMAERVRDIQATQEVSRFAATQVELQVLMDQVVDLIISLFPNIYHAQIFLVDPEQVYAVLRSSSGEAGKTLLSRGHRLEVGGVSVVGQATQDGRVVIARDTAESPIHRRNELLPDTRAEAAIPLRVGSQIIGALDVQSRQSDSFTEDQVNILQTMADQIAIAIVNARLYQESLQRLEQLSASNQQATQQAWRDHLNYRRQRALVAEVGASTPTDLSPLRQMAMAQSEPIVGAATEHQTIPFAVPIILRGQTLGAVEWELPVIDFSHDKVLLAQELVNRLAVSLDNARLFQESRRAIHRERLVNEIAAKLTAQTDIDDILQLAIREVGQALRAPQVSVQLNWGSDAPGSNGHVVVDDER